jgi:hypothetical protein
VVVEKAEAESDWMAELWFASGGPWVRLSAPGILSMVGQPAGEKSIGHINKERMYSGKKKEMREKAWNS